MMTGSQYRASFDASPGAVSASRRFVAGRLSALGADDEVVADFMLAVSEWITNVVQHGDGNGEVVVEVEPAQRDVWHVRIQSPLPLPLHLRSPEQWRIAGTAAWSGRGLGIVREVMDDVVVSDDGTSVALRRFR